MSFVHSAENLLALVREQTDCIGCAVSFGKDSLATLDLCCRMFTRVEGYYLYRVPGLRIVAEWAEVVRRRHGVTVRMYPHFDLVRCFRHAVLQPHWAGLDKTPKIGQADIERQFRTDADVEWIAYGWRRNDSFSRALIMRATAGFDPAARRVYPIKNWRRAEVFAYLGSRGIPLPEGLGRKDQGGLDFDAGALAVLRDRYPDDWQRWLNWFPFSEIQLMPADQIETTDPKQQPAQSPSGGRAPRRNRLAQSSSRRPTRRRMSSTGNPGDRLRTGPCQAAAPHVVSCWHKSGATRDSLYATSGSQFAFRHWRSLRPTVDGRTTPSSAIPSSHILSLAAPSKSRQIGGIVAGAAVGWTRSYAISSRISEFAEGINGT